MGSWGIEEERRYFDNVASRTTFEEFKNSLNSRTGELFWPIIFSKIGNLKDKQVLDLGCGLGIDSAILASKGAKVLGVDLSPGCVEKANSFLRSLGLGGTTQFRVMDVRNLSFPEKRLNLVFGRSILHHIDLEKSLKDVHRITKDKCCFIEPLNKTEQAQAISPETAQRSPYPHLELEKILQAMEKEFPHVWHDESDGRRTIIIAFD